MSQTKAQFNQDRIIELIDKVIERESIPKEGESYADLGWVKFYVRDLATKCKDCADTPSGSKKEN